MGLNRDSLNVSADARPALGRGEDPFDGVAFATNYDRSRGFFVRIVSTIEPSAGDERRRACGIETERRARPHGCLVRGPPWQISGTSLTTN